MNPLPEDQLLKTLTPQILNTIKEGITISQKSEEQLTNQD